MMKVIFNCIHQSPIIFAKIATYNVTRSEKGDLNVHFKIKDGVLFTEEALL